MRKGNDITLLELSNYVKPDVEEVVGRKWVLNGKKNSFFQYIIDRFNGSPTNESVINVYCELIYGKGIALNGQDEIYEELAEIFPKREQMKCIKDFKTFGQYDMQILRAKGGGIAQILHVPTNKLGMDKADSDGNINGVWYCEDWSNPYKYKPEFYPKFEISKDRPVHAISVKSVRPYQAGKFYFSDPDYFAGLQYAELEEEISNYSINHIKNGLSFGYVINFNNGGSISPEEKDIIEYKIKEKLTGSTNAGKFVLSFNDGKDAEVTVVPLEVNDAHSQWEFLSKESQSKILTAHGVTSPLLFGLPSAGGFGANADELDTASKLLQDYQISPKQSVFIDELAPILEIAGLETDLMFIPLRDTYKSTESQPQPQVIDNTVDDEENQEVEEAEVELSSDEWHQDCIQEFIDAGEEMSSDWIAIDQRDCHEITLTEEKLNNVFVLARVPRDDKNVDKSRSKQDTSIFKIRYKYAGSPTPEREFCQKVMFSSKVWKEEALNKEQFITKNMGKGGSNTYNPFLFKGGVNCKHWWQRVIYLKENNKVISAKQARELLNALDPSDRAEARPPVNDPRVAITPNSMPRGGRA